MKAKLVVIGGAVNALFVLFHIWLGWSLHHGAGLAPGARGLAEMLNLGGALALVFLAYASLACRAEVGSTKLGTAVLGLALAIYATRAAGEFVFSPTPRPAIAGVCAVVAALYLTALLAPTPKTEVNSNEIPTPAK